MKLQARTRSCLVLAVLACLAAPGMAHGGRYRGPLIPSLPSIPGGPPPGSPISGSGSRTPGLDVRKWETWWAFNKDEFFPVRGVPLGSDESDPNYARGARLPTRKEVRARIIPALLEGARNRDKEIRNSVAIALGRVGEEPELPHIMKLLEDKDRSVVEGALVGLGLLHCEPAEAELIKFVKNARKPARQRGLAMMALGLSGGEAARAFLYERLGQPRKERRARSAHLSSLQAMAAGLVSGSDLPAADTSKADGATGFIVAGIGKDRIKERFFLPHAYVALSKTRDGAARKQVLAGLKHRKSEVRAGAAIALGRVFKEPSAKTLKRLRRMLEGESDRFVRRLLLVSLGRIGTEGARDILKRNLKHKDRQHRAFAALSLAIAGDRSMIPAFRSQLKSSGDHSLKGAFAIALGLLHDNQSAKLVAEQLKSNKNPELRAHLVQALMLIGDRSYAPNIEAVIAKTRIPALTGAAALSLGLLGAESSQAVLMDLLRDSKTITVKGAVATGLGRRGDASLIDVLVSFVANKREQDLSRAFGFIALGILGEKKPTLSPFSRISIDSQYELRIPVLDELRDLL